MQDRFKFRVWHKKRKKMYDVLHFHTETWYNGGEWVTAKGFNIITQQDINIQVEPKDGVIMQCTGLKDKNGKLIYEEDIVKVIIQPNIIENVSVVKWDNKSARFLRTASIASKNNLVSFWWDCSTEIIGNIYENPELLKDGE